MIMIDKTMASLRNGYYLFYYNSVNSNSKYIYIFEITYDSANVLKYISVTNHRESGIKVSEIIPENEKIARTFLNTTRTGTLFELTDEEYMLEFAGII